MYITYTSQKPEEKHLWSSFRICPACNEWFARFYGFPDRPSSGLGRHALLFVYLFFSFFMTSISLWPYFSSCFLFFSFFLGGGQNEYNVQDDKFRYLYNIRVSPPARTPGVKLLRGTAPVYSIIKSNVWYIHKVILLPPEHTCAYDFCRGADFAARHVFNRFFFWSRILFGSVDNIPLANIMISCCRSYDNGIVFIIMYFKCSNENISDS